MSFRNNRGQRANLTQVLQERQAQRQEAPSTAETYGHRQGTYADTSNTYQYDPWPSTTTITTATATDTATYYTNLSSNSTSSQWVEAFRDSRRRTPAPPPEIVARSPTFTAPRGPMRTNFAGLAPQPLMGVWRRGNPHAGPREICQQQWKLKKQADNAVKKLQLLYRTVMVMNSDYKGKTFGYKNLNDGTAKWYIIADGTPLVTMDIERFVITELCLPKKHKFHNLARYLWRVFEFDAVRYRDVTLVKREQSGVILTAGEKWKIPCGIMAPYAQIKQEPKQLNLFEEDEIDEYITTLGANLK